MGSFLNGCVSLSQSVKKSVPRSESGSFKCAKCKGEFVEEKYLQSHLCVSIPKQKKLQKIKNITSITTIQGRILSIESRDKSIIEDKSLQKLNEIEETKEKIWIPSFEFKTKTNGENAEDEIAPLFFPIMAFPLALPEVSNDSKPEVKASDTEKPEIKPDKPEVDQNTTENPENNDIIIDEVTGQIIESTKNSPISAKLNLPTESLPVKPNQPALGSNTAFSNPISLLERTSVLLQEFLN